MRFVYFLFTRFKSLDNFSTLNDRRTSAKEVRTRKPLDVSARTYLFKAAYVQ